MNCVNASAEVNDIASVNTIVQKSVPDDIDQVATAPNASEITEMNEELNQQALKLITVEENIPVAGKECDDGQVAFINEVSVVGNVYVVVNNDDVSHNSIEEEENKVPQQEWLELTQLLLSQIFFDNILDRMNMAE